MPGCAVQERNENMELEGRVHLRSVSCCTIFEKTKKKKKEKRETSFKNRLTNELIN